MLLPERQVKAARKRRRCHWCGEYIEIGQPYRKWFDASEFCGEVRMHPECHATFLTADMDEDGWEIQENNRGCNCYRDPHCPKCKDKENPDDA